MKPENQYKKVMDNLWKWEFQICGKVFIDEMKKHVKYEYLAEHIWRKFHYYNHNATKTYAHLDSINQKAFIKTIINTLPQILKLYMVKQK